MGLPLEVRHHGLREKSTMDLLDLAFQKSDLLDRIIYLGKQFPQEQLFTHDRGHLGDKNRVAVS